MATEITVSTFTTTFTGKANTTFKLGDNYTVNLFGDGVLIKQVIFTAAGKYANPQRAQQDVKFDAEQAGALSTDGNTKYKLAPPPPPPPLPPSPPPPPKPAPAPVIKDTEQKQPRYIPETRYQKPKSTGGGEFNIKKTGEDYKGKYIETFDKKYYAGSTPEEGGVELQKVNEEFPIGLAFAALPVLAGLLKGFFKPKLKKGDKEKGSTKRFFAQDKKNNKIQEIDQETYFQANGLPNINLAQVNWIIKGPAEDKNFNGYPFEGAASKNKKAINALEPQMPGISAFITDYSFLVEEPVIDQQPVLSFTEVERDPNEAQEDFRKARFDRRSDLIFPSASIFYRSAETTPTPPPPPPLVFVSTWNTSNTLAGSSTSTQVKLPLESTGTYDFTVDWGDGSALENITTAAAGIHTYGNAGTYTISITGTLIGFSFGSTVDLTNTNESLKILSISSWGPIRLGNSGGYFSDCKNLTLNTITDILNLTGTTTLAKMFFECRSITTVGRMNEWDLSGVTNLNGMFQMVGSSTTGVGEFDQDIGAWNVSNVTNFGEMFRFTAKFNNGGSPNIGNWNMSNATNLSNMFSRANRFNQPIANWERSTPGNTSTLANVQLMNDMFSSSNNALGFNKPIGNWNVSSVQTMANLFYRSPFNQDIGDWNVSNVTVFGTNFGAAGSVSPFSPDNLDKIYNGWSTRLVQPNMTILFTSKRTAASNAGKALLEKPPGGTGTWTITDGGL